MLRLTLVMMTVGSKNIMCSSSYDLMAEFNKEYIGCRFLASAMAGMETWGNETWNVEVAVEWNADLAGVVLGVCICPQPTVHSTAHTLYIYTYIQ